MMVTDYERARWKSRLVLWGFTGEDAEGFIDLRAPLVSDLASTLNISIEEAIDRVEESTPRREVSEEDEFLLERLDRR